MPASWSKSLTQALSSLPPPNKAAVPQGKFLPRVAFIGIGNEFNGDDCAGPLIARKLTARLESQKNILILDAGTAPENVTGSLRKFQPQLVVLVDAVDMGAPVGTVAWLAWDAVEGMDAFTHGLPPAVFGSFLRQELGCQVGLIGIQPASLRFDQPPHPAVKASIQKVVRGVIRILS